MEAWTGGATGMLLGAERGRLLRQTARERTVIGTFVIEHPSVATVRAMALAGFDFVVLDMEHSGIGFESLESLVAAAHAAGVAALVRVWGSAAGLIGKALDSGANGVLVPHVGSLERAREVVIEARYPPLGERSFSPLTRYDVFEHDTARIDDRVVVMVQIEGPDGIAAVSEIAATDGIDGVFVGPHDLAGALGVAVDGPEIARASRQLATVVPPGTLLGIYADDPGTSASCTAAGFNLHCLTFDGRLMAAAAGAAVRKARGLDDIDRTQPPSRSRDVTAAT